jgi:hypothetical protein
MTFTYSDALMTDRDKIRLRTGDTQQAAGPRPDKRNFSDEEIAFVLSEESSLVPASIAHTFEVLMSEWAAHAINEREGEISADAKEVSKRYGELAEYWRAKPNGAGSGSASLQVGMIGLDIQQTDTLND